MGIFVVPASVILPIGISDISSSICACMKRAYMHARVCVCACVFISAATYLQVHVLTLVGLMPYPCVLISGNILDFEVMAGCWEGK